MTHKPFTSSIMSERMSVTGDITPDAGGEEVGLRFQVQIGLVREQITLHATDQHQLTLPALREICCSFVDRKVQEIRC